ncbi:MAG: amino acid ABC transporter ATP-binding protein [Spirochaetales bacterium]|nr:amino acid ABC transporter ATP-binding protein [Spirochaetales bacterium]
MSHDLTYDAVNKIYDAKGKNPVHALRDVSFTIRAGELFCLLGPSGCGKTTLLRSTAGLESISSGKMLYGDVDISTIPPYKRNIGMVFQSFALYPHMTIFENVAYGLRVRKIPEEVVRKKVTEAMELVGLGEELKRNPSPSGLSGGQQQRVAIARALAMNPDILFFDEPTSALDPELTAEILKVIRQLAEEHMTMVIVTHEINFARNVSDRIVFMADGVIVEQGSAEQLVDNPQNERTRAFLANIGKGRD